MMNKEKCSCCNSSSNNDVIIGQYVCYCNQVTEDDIKDAIEQGAETVQEVIKKTGAIYLLLFFHIGRIQFYK